MKLPDRWRPRCRDDNEHNEDATDPEVFNTKKKIDAYLGKRSGSESKPNDGSRSLCKHEILLDFIKLCRMKLCLAFCTCSPTGL